MFRIPFNRPYSTGFEVANIQEAIAQGKLSGDGAFTRRCHEFLRRQSGAASVLLTHSCTAALEMAALLVDIGPGDEVIMPSYTFVSTANAFVLRGATPVFVDVRSDTGNIDEMKVAPAITGRTKAIVPVHYAGVSAEMSVLADIAGAHGLAIVEDAAQGMFSKYRGKALGTLGSLGTLSFHETKNIICGEGGALLVNDRSLVERAEVIREKGTDRSRFFRGQVDKYTWVDLGSSYLPSELVAAFLSAQLERGSEITSARKEIWNRYHEAFECLERDGLARRPVVPDDCVHNGHMYYLMLESLDQRTRFIQHMAACGIGCAFHYVPLHKSQFGKSRCKTIGDMTNTDRFSDCLARLPIWVGLGGEQDYVIDSALHFFR